MAEPPSTEPADDAARPRALSADTIPDPDAEAARLLGLGPKLRELLQDFDPTGGGAAPHELPPGGFGRYRVIRLIGEGGMGSVYEAEQQSPRRRVALKVIKPGMDTKQVIARFEVEREALARMDHPGIARVFDAGATDAGRPFFAMELVEGVPITDYCDAQELTVRRRLELFIAVCRAVQHAHQKGIIHRDLKPSNVLVALVDGDPVPKVIDFGIAKATEPQPSDRTALTELQQLVGTPEYMSPEQAGANGGDVDTRSDVYSLGVLLYELLTGTTPFADRRLREVGYDEARRIIRQDEPPRPSTRIVQSADGATCGNAAESARGTDLTTLRRTVRGELDWIVMKCLEKDRSRRYGTASDLAADLERHLRNEPVHAGPPTTSYRLRKFARRHRAPLVVVGLIVVLLVGGITGTTVGMVRSRAAEYAANKRKWEAEREATTARAATDFLASILASADRDVDGGPEVRLVNVLDRAAAEIGEKLKDQPEVEMRARFALSQSYWTVGRSEEQRKNLWRAYELVRQTRNEKTEPGLKVVIATVDHFPNLPHREAVARAALADARRTLDHHGVTVWASYVLAEILWETGRSQEAETLLQPLAEECRRRPLGGQEPFYHLALVLRDLGKSDEAEAAFREALAAAQKDRGSARVRLRTYDQLAQLLLERQRPTEAAVLCMDALADCRPRLGDTHPQIENFMSRAINLLRRVGRTQEAAELDADYRSTVATLAERRADTFPALYRRARARAYFGRVREAAEDLAACIEIEPEQFDAWYLLGCLLACLGERDGYDAHCKRMVQRFGHSQDGTIARRTAKTYFLVPRSGHELELGLAVAARDGDERQGAAPYFRMLKAQVAYRNGEFARGIEWLNSLPGQPPSSPAAVVSVDLLLAMCCHQNGQAADARAALDRAGRLLASLPATPEWDVPEWWICHVFWKEATTLLSEDTPAEGRAANPR